MSQDGQQALGRLRIGVDVGGTFTDLVAASSEGWLHVSKVPSVPGDPGEGVVNALNSAAQALSVDVRGLLAACELFVHGSTIATNTVLEGKGATVGLITTPGFRDSLEIRRGMRADPWDHRTPYAPVLVPRYLRLPVPGRIDSDGSEVEAVDESAIEEVLDAFAADGVQSIAVCLFNSYANPAHEKAYAERITASLQARGIEPWLSTSHEILPVLGEYERSATTVLNAYIAPRTVGYLRDLSTSLSERGLRGEMLLIQNNGGSIPASHVANRPVTLLLSGPAAGTGALDIARVAAGTGNLLSLEIGGTSADVMLLENGQVPVSEQLSVGGYDCSVPSVDIHTIGSGGGTIAWVDAAGLLRVGPEGAGAKPGPAAYGLGGTRPTVTDALLVLGRLAPGRYAGGSVVLNGELARAALQAHVAQPLGLPVEEAAAGVIRLLEQNLLQAVEQVTLERGLDPRTFTLVPAGGAGPMHGAAVGRRLGCPSMYVPRLSGAFCALGMLHVDVRHDAMRSFFHPLAQVADAGIEAVFVSLEADVRSMLEAEGFDGDRILVERQADLRYIGQQWSLRVNLNADDDTDAVRGSFEAVHENRYRHIQPDGVVEVTAVHVVGYGRIPGLELPVIADAESPPAASGSRRMYYDESVGWVTADIYNADGLCAGHTLDGPAIIEAQTTTLCIGPSDRLSVDAFGNFTVQLD